VLSGTSLSRRPLDCYGGWRGQDRDSVGERRPRPDPVGNVGQRFGYPVEAALTLGRFVREGTAIVLRGSACDWQLNKLALQWLQKAGEEPEPMAAYLPQLAVWAIRMGHFRAPEPLSPSQPRHEAVEETAEALAAMVGPKPAARAMNYLLDNPSQPPEDARRYLLNVLQKADSP
jgi:hypothetical protein